MVIKLQNRKSKQVFFSRTFLLAIGVLFLVAFFASVVSAADPNDIEEIINAFVE